MRKVLPVATAIVVLLLLYGVGVEPARIRTTKVVISEGELSRVLAGRKLALLSDLHFRDSGNDSAATILGSLQEIKPDMIALAGDYVAWGGRDRAYDRVLSLMSRLEAPLGVFAVLGDADQTHSRRSCEFCHERGSGAFTQRHRVRFLRDAEETIATDRGHVRVVGLDTRSRPPGGEVLDRVVRPGEAAVVIAHSSVVFGAIPDDREVLVLSGDTHGGQVWLPDWLWGFVRLKPDPDHIGGLYREGEKTLYVSRGIGTSRLRFRLGVRPEIVVIEFGDSGR